MLPPERRLGRVLELIAAEKYFVLRAGRQTGKTTSAFWLVQHFNGGDRQRCAWVDVQSARDEPDPRSAFRTILESIQMAVRNDLPGLPIPDLDALLANPATAILTCLQQLAAASPLPLIILFDEADGLVGQAMVLFLTQLRQGYIARSKVPFPRSLALIGLRDVRDYALSQKQRRTVTWLGTSSPFNITTEAATLASFSEADVAELLGQHTADTGQRFSPAAVEQIYALSQGQPWLVNALAEWTVDRERDRAVAITAEHVVAAKDGLILERRSHIDSLLARLHEPRVQRIIEPMLLGQGLPADVVDDDVAYVLGLGLCRIKDGLMEIANPIYKEVIPRALTYVTQISLGVKPAWYRTTDGRLDMPKLLRSWQKFWRQDGHLAADGFAYKEAGPHLMLMAFLQRIVNGGGRIEREYALGRGALDLMIFFNGERLALEVKLRRDTMTRAEAQEQILQYLDVAGLSEGWLVIFDLRKEVAWEEKLTTEQVQLEGKRIWVIGC